MSSPIAVATGIHRAAQLCEHVCELYNSSFCSWQFFQEPRDFVGPLRASKRQPGTSNPLRVLFPWSRPSKQCRATCMGTCRTLVVISCFNGSHVCFSVFSDYITWANQSINQENQPQRTMNQSSKQASNQPASWFKCDVARTYN